MILGWVVFRIAWFLSFWSSSCFVFVVNILLYFIYLPYWADKWSVVFCFVFLAFFFLALSAHLRNWYFFPVSIRVVFVYLTSVVFVWIVSWYWGIFGVCLHLLLILPSSGGGARRRLSAWLLTDYRMHSIVECPLGGHGRYHAWEGEGRGEEEGECFFPTFSTLSWSHLYLHVWEGSLTHSLIHFSPERRG